MRLTLRLRSLRSFKGLRWYRALHMLRRLCGLVGRLEWHRADRYGWRIAASFESIPKLIPPVHFTNSSRDIVRCLNHGSGLRIVMATSHVLLQVCVKSTEEDIDRLISYSISTPTHLCCTAFCSLPMLLQTCCALFHRHAGTHASPFNPTF